MMSDGGVYGSIFFVIGVEFYLVVVIIVSVVVVVDVIVVNVLAIVDMRSRWS